MRITTNQLLSLVAHTVAASPELSAQTRVDPFRIGDQDRCEMLRWIRAATTPQRVVMRSVIVLLAGAGWANARLATEIGVSRRTVALWKQRFQVAGCRALLVDAPGRGRKPGRDRHVVARIAAVSRQHPPHGTRWTVRSLAREIGSSHATVQRVLRELDHGAAPIQEHSI